MQRHGGDHKALLREIIEALEGELKAGEAARDSLVGVYDAAVVDQLGICVAALSRSLVTSTAAQDGSGSPGPAAAAVDADLDVRLRTLSALAHQHIHGVPFYLVERRWLALYTDAAVLLSAARLVQLEHTADSEDAAAAATARACVDALDRAIIVAGALGPRRMAWAQALIAACQVYLGRAHARPSDRGDLEPIAKRARRTSPSPTPAAAPPASTVAPDPALQYAPAPIPSTTAYPSLSSYAAQSSRPLILRGLLSSPTSPCSPWPALHRWTTAAELVDRVGRGRLVPVEVGGAYTEQGWGQRLVPFEQFLAAAGFGGADGGTLGAGVGGAAPGTSEVRDEPATSGDGRDAKSAPPAGCERPQAEDGEDGHAADTDAGAPDDPPGRPGPPLYLAQHDLFAQFPQLRSDFTMPDYVWAAPPAPADCPAYTPPDEPLVHVWVGPGRGRVVSPAHTAKDPYFNCYAQVVGHKRVWLAPPHVGPYMYAYGREGARGDGLGRGEGGSESVDGGNDDEGDADGEGGDGEDGEDGEDGDDGDDVENGDDSAGSDDAADIAAEYMTNTSAVPVLRPLPAFRAALRRYPRFAVRALPHSLEAVLGPGDVLLFPPGWWHAMRGEGAGPGWSVSMWF